MGFGWGTGIRTPTNSSRDCCPAIRRSPREDAGILAHSVESRKSRMHKSVGNSETWVACDVSSAKSAREVRLFCSMLHPYPYFIVSQHSLCCSLSRSVVEYTHAYDTPLSNMPGRQLNRVNEDYRHSHHRRHHRHETASIRRRRGAHIARR